MTLEFDDVSKAFGEQTVIDHLTGRFEFDHVLAFVGPSGGGKSTLLRLVAGLTTPDSGTIRVDGTPIPTTESALRAYRSRIGIVFQAYNLFPHLSALDNIVLPLVQVHGKSPTAARARATAILDRLQLAPHAAKRPAELSGGQRQRVAIARAIAIDAQFVILDEPTSALDPEMTGEVLDLIEELRADNRSLLLVSHEMGFVRHAADLVAFVADGTITESAPGPEFFDLPQHPPTQRFLKRVFKY
jgi:polar amino acid transport system ATP-binding protein